MSCGLTLPEEVHYFFVVEGDRESVLWVRV